MNFFSVTENDDIKVNKTHIISSKIHSEQVIVWVLMETSEFAVELCKKEEKDNVMENLFAMFQIRKAVGHSQIYFKTGILKNFLRISQEKSRIRVAFK